MLFGSTFRILDQVTSLPITHGWENKPIARISKDYNSPALQFPFEADIVRGARYKSNI